MINMFKKFPRAILHIATTTFKNTVHDNIYKKFENIFHFYVSSVWRTHSHYFNALLYEVSSLCVNKLHMLVPLASILRYNQITSCNRHIATYLNTQRSNKIQFVDGYLLKIFDPSVNDKKEQKIQLKYVLLVCVNGEFPIFCLYIFG